MLAPVTDFTKYYDIDKKTKCWNWRFRTIRRYGRITVKSKKYLAHRYFYEKYVGKIGDNLQIDHLCKNTMCVNPEHLEAVTGTENVRRSSATKLNIEDVTKIRKMYETKKYTQEYLGSIFNVTKDNISKIVNYKQWSTA